MTTTTDSKIVLRYDKTLGIDEYLSQLTSSDLKGPEHTFQLPSPITAPDRTLAEVFTMDFARYSTLALGWIPPYWSTFGKTEVTGVKTFITEYTPAAPVLA